MSVYAITQMKIRQASYAVCFGLDRDRKLISFHLSPMDDEISINQIYIAKVERIVPDIHAAFVKISDDRTVYLPLSKAKCPVYTSKPSKSQDLCAGDELLLQISQEALKTKDPQGTTELSLQSNYFVLTLGTTGFNISKKIKGPVRDSIKELLDWYQKDYLSADSFPVSFGIVTRTVAENASVADLKEDLLLLSENFRKLLTESVHKTRYSLVYRESPSFIGHLKNRRLTSEDKILTDQKDLYDLVWSEIPSYRQYLSLYTDPKVSLSVLYNLTGNIDSILSPRIWLKSGGNIIIEQLETLTFIDVNSAKSSKGKGKAQDVNREALEEICRQIRLRNLSGMILIDFINMEEAETEAFINSVKQAVKEDPVGCQYHDMTALGIIELTRKKAEKSIKQILEKSQ